jgi:hypothetical protein
MRPLNRAILRSEKQEYQIRDFLPAGLGQFGASLS